MDLSDHCAKSLDNIALKQIKSLGINSMGLIDPWDDSIDIIALHRVHKLLGINPMGLITPRDNSIEIIAFRSVRNVVRE